MGILVQNSTQRVPGALFVAWRSLIKSLGMVVEDGVWGDVSCEDFVGCCGEGF